MRANRPLPRSSASLASRAPTVIPRSSEFEAVHGQESIPTAGRYSAGGLFSMRRISIMEQDLTIGSVPGQLIRFAFPLFLSNLLQSCYSVVDMAVVGRFVGGAGLAAVSSASRICFLVTSLGMGITIGGGVLVVSIQGSPATSAASATRQEPCSRCRRPRPCC